MTQWLKKLDWMHVFEIAAGVLAGMAVLVGIIYGAGVNWTNLGRDVERNANEIERHEEAIEANAQCIAENRAEMQSQRATLSRIEEGVEWIKRDLGDGK